jgi:arginase
MKECPIYIANVHLDLGAGRRGTDMGSSAMHVAGLVPGLQRLGYRIASIQSIGVQSAEESNQENPRVRYLSVITDLVRRLADAVHHAVAQGQFPMVLGGDHAQAIGTVSGLARVWRARGHRLGVVWVDAHADMNTPETSPSGNIHGMPLAALLGHGPDELTTIAGDAPALLPEDVVVFGARDIDAAEARLVQSSGVRVYTMSEIDRRGMATCFEEALARVRAHTQGVHLSFDLDGVDPEVAPGVGTPVPGGLSLRESLLICEWLHQSGDLVGIEMVELNPTLDVRNQTGKLAVWLLLSALGKTIL